MRHGGLPNYYLFLSNNDPKWPVTRAKNTKKMPNNTPGISQQSASSSGDTFQVCSSSNSNRGGYRHGRGGNSAGRQSGYRRASTLENPSEQHVPQAKSTFKPRNSTSNNQNDSLNQQTTSTSENTIQPPSYYANKNNQRQPKFERTNQHRNESSSNNDERTNQFFKRVPSRPPITDLEPTSVSEQATRHDQTKNRINRRQQSNYSANTNKNNNQRTNIDNSNVGSTKPTTELTSNPTTPEKKISKPLSRSSPMFFPSSYNVNTPTTSAQAATKSQPTQNLPSKKQTESKARKKKNQNSGYGSGSSDDEEDYSQTGQAITFAEDEYIIGFASMNGSFYFCWQLASKESESQNKIRDILTAHSEYSVGLASETMFSVCIKNKSIYAALKKFVKKLIKQNQPYNPYLVNSHSSMLMKQFLISSNTWLEFSANLPSISNKFAKLKAREVKQLLAEFSTEWNYFDFLDFTKAEHLSSFMNDSEEKLIQDLLDKVSQDQYSKFKRRSHLLTCSWVCKCPNGLTDVFKELVKVIRSIYEILPYNEERLNQIFESEKNNAKAQKMTICELVAKIEKIDIEASKEFKHKKPEVSIFSEKRSVDVGFTEQFLKELAAIFALNVYQGLKYKYDFTHKKQKGAANDFKKLYTIVDVETQKQKTAFNAKIQSAYKEEDTKLATLLGDEEREKLIHQLIQFITYDKEYRCFQRYYDLLKTEEDDINKPFGWFQYPYHLKAIQWMKRLNSPINWIEIYLNRIQAKPEFDPKILEQIDKEYDNSIRISQMESGTRVSFLDHSSTTFTIDRKGTKDCDDAFTILYHDANCIQIAVHITDVASHILRNVDLSKSTVEANDESNGETLRHSSNKCRFRDHPIFQSTIFSEAERRVMSIYVPGKEETYAPCLPKHLSEELLSLIDKRPKEVITHMFVIYLNGNVQFKGVFKGLIQVTHSYFFEEADEKIDSPTADPFWKQLYDCCCAIHKKRLDCGAKKFTPGVVPLGGVNLTLIGEMGNEKPHIDVSSDKQQLSKSSKIITEFSILLNSTMARYFYDNRICGLYKEFYQIYNKLLPESIKDMGIEDFVEVASILDTSGNEMNFVAQGQLQQSQNYESLWKYEYDLKQQGSRNTTNIGKITTNPTKFHQNIIGVELYMQLSSPLRRWLDLVLQVQLVHHLNTVEAGIEWTGLEDSLFSEETLHNWSERVSDKIETVKDMERQVLYHYFIVFLRQKMIDCGDKPFLLKCISEINFRKGKRLNHKIEHDHHHHIDLNNLITNKKPVFTQLLRLRLVGYNYFAVEVSVTSNTIDMDEMTLIKVLDIDPYTHTMAAEFVK